MHQSVSAHTARLIVRALSERMSAGVPAVLGTLELEPSLLTQREATLSKARMDALWDRALQLSQDDGFGLSVAASLRPGMLGAVEYLFRNMKTLGDAYAQAVRFQNLLQNNTSRWSVDLTGDHRVYGYELLPPRAPAYRHIVEFACAAFVGLGRQVASEAFAPLAVSFRHEAGCDERRYVEAFGVVPRFSQPTNTIQLSEATCDVGIEGAQPDLAEIVQFYARHQQERVAADSTAEATRRAVSETMRTGEVSLTKVGRYLGMSERTLRRRLSEEGVTFQSLVDEVRFEAAKAYLAQPKLSTAETALLLGFSEVGAFYRAFKRWYGASLSEYRAAQSKR